MANAQKVANIFELASLAFGKLAELTLDLKIYQAQAEQTQSSSSRWTIAEVEQLKDAISRFGADLSKIAEVLDTKTVTQIKHKIRNKAFMEAGLEEPPEEDLDDLSQIPRVSTVANDKGRRKQTFSERNEEAEPLGKKRRIEGISPQSNLIPPQPGTQTAGLLMAKHAQQMPPRMSGQPRSSGLGSTLSDYDYMQGMPHGQRPERAVGVPPRKLSMEQEAKYEDYSDSGSERYEEPDDDDDDDDEESDEERYYSEEEGGR
uniref:SANT domain-containing protein n=1 Tax=Schistocephalus solidus TaxID=70667 RepID=A0A0X3PML1_SCHSO